MRGFKGLVAAAAVLVTLSACSGVTVGDDLVVESPGKGGEEGSTAPYDGPLKAKTPEWVVEDSPLEGGGASLLTLECAGELFEGGPGNYGGGDSGGESSPDAALQQHLSASQMWRITPERGYRVERRSGNRVLFSYDVGGRTRAAVIVAENLKGKDGWIAETYALCDPSEFRAAERADLDLRVWSDEQGRPVPTTKVNSSMGPKHCDWQSVEILHLGRDKAQRQYFRDPEAKFAGSDLLNSRYEDDVPMPGDATDTGFRYQGRELWLAGDKKDAYVRVDGDHVERWPGAKERIGCA
ncbi:hypothetical protein [Streptomyces sp. NBC_01304]|uniref:hypothetical protein n=1 Tax=Streptomyces sp. NBC_01304 TaxID=2903818 RepID=UPI002E1602E2|nr:hypothetical protein OG430_03830 [Streptomyces sp. NBC_01304]